jgi:hypothetical protein
VARGYKPHGQCGNNYTPLVVQTQPAPFDGIRVALPPTMKYRLIRAVTGFNPETGQVIVIPPGETVSTVISKNTVGLCSVTWNGNLVRVIREDIERNGIVESEESLG